MEGITIAGLIVLLICFTIALVDSIKDYQEWKRRKKENFFKNRQQ